MKIAVISDTHDNLANLEKFLELAERNNIESIIHCGDVTTPETLSWLADRFVGPIKLACGNMEIRREEFPQVVKRHKNLEIFTEIGKWELEIRGVPARVAFVHKPEKTVQLATSGEYVFVFYGHTHKPWIREVANTKDSPSGHSQGESLVATIVANPGTLGGVFTAPTFAVLETATGQLELIRV